MAVEFGLGFSSNFLCGDERLVNSVTRDTRERVSLTGVRRAQQAFVCLCVFAAHAFSHSRIKFVTKTEERRENG